MTREFYFLRHGQSEANAANRFAGRFDSPLTAQGQGEAEAERAIVENLTSCPTRIVTSTLRRAMETADIINLNLQLPVSREPLLCEQDYGDYTGRHRGDLVASGITDHWLAPPNGETYGAFRIRIVRGLDAVLTDDPDDQVLIVGHGGMADLLLGRRGIPNSKLLHFSGAGDQWTALDHCGAVFAAPQPVLA